MNKGFYGLWFAQCSGLVGIGGHIFNDVPLMAIFLWFIALVSHVAYATNVKLVEEA